MAEKAPPKSKKTKASPGFWSQQSHRLLAGAMIALGVIGLISALTFYCDSPSHNWLGMVGHAIGWISRFLLGLASLPLFVWMVLRGLESQKKQIPPHLPFSLVGISVIASALLLNILAENYPRVARPFASWAHVQSFSSAKGKARTQEERYNLGGVPLYFLYKDLPKINLKNLLSDRGLTLISSAALFTVAAVFARRRRQYRIDHAPTRSPKELQPDEPVVTKEKSVTTPAPALNLLQETRLNKTPSKAQKAPEVEKGVVLEKIPEKSSTPATSLKEISAVAILKKAKSKAMSAGSNEYLLPSLDLLTSGKTFDARKLDGEIDQQSRLLEETLLSFGIEGKVVQVHVGPRLLSFEVQPAIGVKVQRIKALENDIALNLQAKSLRIIAPIPGKAAVGIEIPTKNPQEVNFKNMVQDYQKVMKEAGYAIPVVLGKTVSGEDVHFDLAKMPHMIIAGATGSGKSVCINTLIVSVLLHASPDDIKLLMIDPKKVELTPYTRLPHMIAPVITEPHQAVEALRWLVAEMEKRYEILKRMGLRHIEAFNKRKRDEAFESTLGIEVPIKFPYIVGIIDELADLMMTCPSDIETPIARIAQMARAVGIHLVLATQRPSREVITGLIKANFPARISFKVSSRVNSQIILDETGAECLLGNGDMLFLHPTKGSLIRAQGAYIRDEDIQRVVETIEMQAQPNYLLKQDILSAAPLLNASATSEDDLYENARTLVIETGTASTTFLQRKLRIGYARAASLIDELQENGVVGPSEGGKPRKILVNFNKIEPDSERAE